jgi:hypothetical protein
VEKLWKEKLAKFFAVEKTIHTHQVGFNFFHNRYIKKRFNLRIKQTQEDRTMIFKHKGELLAMIGLLVLPFTLVNTWTSEDLRIQKNRDIITDCFKDAGVSLPDPQRLTQSNRPPKITDLQKNSLELCFKKNNIELPRSDSNQARQNGRHPMPTPSEQAALADCFQSSGASRRAPSLTEEQSQIMRQCMEKLSLEVTIPMEARGRRRAPANGAN